MDNNLLKKFNDIETHHWWWEGRRTLLKNMIGQKTNIRIVDIGCGTGETLTFLKRIYPKSMLFGIDTSNNAIEFSKNRGHRNIYKANALKLPFKNDYFDFVLLLDVIEHIQNDNLAIKEVRRVLKKGGKLIITAPALPVIWSGHDSMQGHKRRYTYKTICALANKADLEINVISYFNFIFSIPIVAIRLLSKLKPFRHFGNYDNKLNFNIANLGFVNTLLRNIFVWEVSQIPTIRYPFGISLLAVFTKK